MSYECIRCNKLFTKKSNYGCHVNRKYPCKVPRKIENNIHERNGEILISPTMSPTTRVNPPNIPPISPQLDKNHSLSINLVVKQDEILHLTPNSDHLLCTGTDSNNKVKYFCVDCKKTYSSNWALKKHQINSCNKVKIKILKCDICSTVFARSDGLKRHVEGRCKGPSNSKINDIDDEFAKKEQEIIKLLSEMRIIMNKSKNADIQNIPNVNNQ